MVCYFQLGEMENAKFISLKCYSLNSELYQKTNILSQEYIASILNLAWFYQGTRYFGEALKYFKEAEKY